VLLGWSISYKNMLLQNRLTYLISAYPKMPIKSNFLELFPFSFEIFGSQKSKLYLNELHIINSIDNWTSITTKDSYYLA
jgi:hypothetical protein